MCVYVNTLINDCQLRTNIHQLVLARRQDGSAVTWGKPLNSLNGEDNIVQLLLQLSSTDNIRNASRFYSGADKCWSASIYIRLVMEFLGHGKRIF